MLVLSCFRRRILQSNLPNEKSQRTEKQFMMAKPCAIGNGRNHPLIPHPEMRHAFELLDPQMPMAPWSMYGCFTKHLVRMQFSLPLTEDLSSECQRLPLVLCQAVLHREKTKGNQFSVSSMLFHPTKNLSRGHNRPLCPPLDG